MTSARRSPAVPHLPPLSSDWRTIDLTQDATWPAGLRALLLLTGAAHTADPLLARSSDEDLQLLRAALAMFDLSEPTSAA